MVIDFSRLPKPGKEKPVIVLKNLDGTAIQTLGYAFNVKAELSYNEISTLTFDIPSKANGVNIPRYSDVVGMRIVDLVGCGQFILIDPHEESDGVRRIKSCKAYSLEYEFAKKDFFLEAGTYNFWNPLSPENTILGRIREKMPDWTIGSIDEVLIGRYRTFDNINKKAYDFIKSDVQESYGCIFDFDTYNRVINIVSVTENVPTKQVYLSEQRLIKKLEINENSDNIVTCLDVNGAEDVTIRSVNPTGTNKIFNLDYFMNETNFTAEFISKWRAWESACANRRTSYYNITMEYNLKLMQILTEQKHLDDLQRELLVLDNQRAVIVQGIAQNTGTQSELSTINSQINSKQNEIASQNTLINGIKLQASVLYSELQSINEELSMESYFTSEEMTVLRRYFIEDTLQDSSFVTQTATTYSNEDLSSVITNRSLSITGGKITTTDITTSKKIYSIDGGHISISTLSADVIKATVEFNSGDGSFVFTAYMNGGTVGESEFKSGTITTTGRCNVPTLNTNALGIYIIDGRLYFTKNASTYEQHEVEWDLLAYGEQVLIQKASPTYEFSVECGNFLSIDDFMSFRNELTLGKRIYLNIDNISPLTPYVVTVNINFEIANDFNIEFSNSYTTFDKTFALAKLLEQSVSMGKTLSAKSGIYSEFVNSGASTSVKRFMDNALDVAKNAVMSSGNQAISYDDSGLHVRKWRDASHTGYEDEQIWIVDNMIAFTKDNWETANMAIGKIFDHNLISESNPSGLAYGIVAPYLVGTILAGQNLIIDTENGSFKVDSNGVYIDSLKFYITHGGHEYDTTLADEFQTINGREEELAQNLADAIEDLQGQIVDGAVTTYYQNSIPTETNQGDLWYVTGSINIVHDGKTYCAGKLYRYNGESWDVITDADVIKAISDAATAQETADGKIVSYYQNYAPYNPSYGDIWFNTSTTNQVVRNIEVGDVLGNINLSFDTTQEISNDSSRNVIVGSGGKFYSSPVNGAPSLLISIGSSTGVSLYQGGWLRSIYPVPSTFGRVTSVDKTSPFYACILGTFNNTYEQGKLYRYNGTAWVKVEDKGIIDLGNSVNRIDDTLSGIINENGYLKAEQISGYINSATAKMKSSSGNVLFDNDGIWLMDKATKSNATKAVWLNENGIQFGSGSASNDPASNFDWKTAINLDGIVATALAGKTLSGCYISGGNLSIGNGSFVVTSDGSLTAKSGTFSGVIKGAAFQTLSGTSMMTSDYKFSSDYLELRGLSISNGTNVTFSIDQNGNVNILGNIKMGSGSTIDWSTVSEQNPGNSYAYIAASNAYGLANTANNNAATAQASASNAFSYAGSAYSRATDAYSLADSAYSLANSVSVPSYIKSTYIDSTRILSPTIYGGSFYATGQGRYGDPAYYIYNGFNLDYYGNPVLGTQIGYLSYDDTGAGNSWEARERVFLTTLNGVALKIKASGNMSLQASEFIYVASQMNFAGGITLGDTSYGTTLPSYPQTGRLFFLLS